VAIQLETYEKIRYLYEQEGLSQRNIAKQLSISRNTVKKYFDGSSVPWVRQGVSGRCRTVISDEVKEFVQSCLEEDEKENIKKQKHTAKRIYDRLVEEKNFSGGESTIRELVASLRGKLPKVFVPLSFEPGEAIQVDWGEATIYLNGKKTKINLWCMRECCSDDIFCKAFYRQNEESFLEGQVNGFEHFGGVPQRVIFDNARVAVKEGFGVHAKVQNRYAALAAHYAFKTEFCNVAQGHEKGLVEGLVGWARRNMWVPIPRVTSIDELNEEILRRCLKYREHQVPGREQPVGVLAKIAAVKMMNLPNYKFDTSKSIIARVSDFSTVRFDYNQYSVPVQYAGKEITVKGYGNEIVMLYQNIQIAQYHRCYERGQTEYQLEHYMDLIERRPRSVFNAQPVKSTVPLELLEIGKQLSGPKEMVKLLRLYSDHGEEKLMTAIHSLSCKSITVMQIESILAIEKPVLPQKLNFDVKVEKPELCKYDGLLSMRAAV